MIELLLKTPINNDIVFSDVITINYEVRDTSGVFSKVVFEVNNQVIEKTARTDVFQIPLPEGEYILTCYVKNKYNKEILETRKTILVSTKPVTLELKNKLSSVVSSSIPDFLEQDYQTFVDFIKYYYIWLESTKNVNLIPHTLEQYFDVDTIPPELVDRFQETYLSTFPKQFSIDRETGNAPDVTKVLKRIKDFYSKKGTEDSFRFLFRVMFDTEITFTYPREKLLKASEAQWVVPKFIRAKNLNEEDAALLIGTELYVLDENGSKTFSAIIEDTYTFYYASNPITTLNLINVTGNLNSSKVYYSKNVFGVIEEYSIDLYSMIIDYYLYKCPDSFGYPIYDFEVGMIVNLVNSESYIWLLCNGGETVEALTEDGCNPLYIEILDPERIDLPDPLLKHEDLGAGFKAQISKVNEKGEIEEIQILDPGFNWGLNVNGYGTQFTGKPNPKTQSIERVYDCRIRYVTGYLFTGTGFYRSKKSLLSQMGILQDNFYYQQNSYEIGSNVNSYKFSDILKQNVHPAGYKAFYRYDVLDNIIEKRELTTSEPGSFELRFGFDEDGNTLGSDVYENIIQTEFQTFSNFANFKIGLEPPEFTDLNILEEEIIYTTDLEISTNDIPEDSDGIEDSPIIIPNELTSPPRSTTSPIE
jgi:hypothetical protein